MTGWSDIVGLHIAAEEDEQGFAESSERIKKILQQEIDKGVPSESIILAGFSQGGALALHTGPSTAYGAFRVSSIYLKCLLINSPEKRIQARRVCRIEHVVAIASGLSSGALAGE